MDSSTLIRLLKDDGWYHDGCKGDHHHFRHPTKSNKVTIPHPEKDIKPGTLHRILKDAGLK